MQSSRVLSVVRYLYLKIVFRYYPHSPYRRISKDTMVSTSAALQNAGNSARHSNHRFDSICHRLVKPI